MTASSKWLTTIFFIILCSGVVFNFRNSAVRSILISIWVFFPVILLLVGKPFISRSRLIDFLVALFFLASFVISFIINYDTFSFEFSGPSVEKFTPFLVVSSIFIYILFENISKSGSNFSNQFITRFYVFLVVFFICDALLRWYIRPDAFLNYTIRSASKNTGFLSTTNINGQIISFFIGISWFVKFRFKKTIQWILFFLLITAMARAAFVALIVGYLIYRFINFKGLNALIVKSIMIVLLLCLLVIDPLNFSADGSLHSKINFIFRVAELLSNASLTSLIFGFGASYDYIVGLLGINGWSPHLPFLKAVLYFGIIGVVFYFYSLIYIVRQESLLFIPVIIFFILSLAGAPIFWPTLIVGLIIVKVSLAENCVGANL